MAKQQPTDQPTDSYTPPPPTSTVDISAIADAIAKGIVQAGNETGPIKQVPVTRYRNRTIYNPEGLFPHKRPQFTRDYYQNGKLIVADVLTPADIAALEQLRAGRYLNRLVEVIEREAEGSEMRSLEVRYPSATHDQRIAAGKVFTSFSELLQKLLAEQAVAA
jgi:hypothetical protein